MGGGGGGGGGGGCRCWVTRLDMGVAEDAESSPVR